MEPCVVMGNNIFFLLTSAVLYLTKHLETQCSCRKCKLVFRYVLRILSESQAHYLCSIFFWVRLSRFSFEIRWALCWTYLYVTHFFTCYVIYKELLIRMILSSCHVISICNCNYKWKLHDTVYFCSLILVWFELIPGHWQYLSFWFLMNFYNTTIIGVFVLYV